MKLRWRLTLLFASLLGAAVLIFGILSYGMVNLLLLNHVDETLEITSNNLLDRMRISRDGELVPGSLDEFHPVSNQIIQVWDSADQLVFGYPDNSAIILSPEGLQQTAPHYITTQYNSESVRVLSLPLMTSRQRYGVLQIGMPLTFFTQTRSTVGAVLAVVGAGLVLVTLLIAQVTVRRTLQPLDQATELVKLITTTQDLSRRVAVPINPQDEVGALVTAFNQTLERLEQLFISQQRLLSDVSHELRTPLTVIKGNLSLLAHQGATDPESLRSIQMEVDRLNRMIGDLLLLGQVDAGGFRLNLGRVQLDDLVLEVVTQLHGMTDKVIDIKVSEIDQIAIQGDRDRLKQVLLNLGGNAVQYTQAGGMVKLALRRDGDSAVIDVIDNGPGIHQQDLEHIFERFYRAERSRTRSHGVGYGLGLSIADRIVKAHHGKLSVVSKVGEGSTFSIRLPLEQPLTEES